MHSPLARLAARCTMERDVARSGRLRSRDCGGAGREAWEARLRAQSLCPLVPADRFSVRLPAQERRMEPTGVLGATAPGRLCPEWWKRKLLCANHGRRRPLQRAASRLATLPPTCAASAAQLPRRMPHARPAPCVRCMLAPGGGAHAAQHAQHDSTPCPDGACEPLPRGF